MSQTQANTAPTPFERLGGDAALRELVDRFYDLMDLEPEFAGIRALHPPGLQRELAKAILGTADWMRNRPG